AVGMFQHRTAWLHLDAGQRAAQRIGQIKTQGATGVTPGEGPLYGFRRSPRFTDIDRKSASTLEGGAVSGNSARRCASGQHCRNHRYAAQAQHTAATTACYCQSADIRFCTTGRALEWCHWLFSSFTPKRLMVLSNTSLSGSCCRPCFQMSRASSLRCIIHNTSPRWAATSAEGSWNQERRRYSTAPEKSPVRYRYQP